MALKEFKCRKCGYVHCESGDRFFRLKIQGRVATVYVEAFEFTCPKCEAKRLWEQKHIDRKPKVK